MQVDGEWRLTAQRLAIHLPTGTAVVADLHLGYDQARRNRGDAVPVWGLGETISVLTTAFREHAVRRLLIAGDLMESQGAANSVAAFLEWLAGTGVEFAGLVPGNHDRSIAINHLPIYAEGLVLGRWRVLHGDRALPRGRLVFGHIHPWFRWGCHSAPCFLISSRRIIVPAFSLDAAGVNVLRHARWGRYRAAVIVGGRVLDFGKISTIQKHRRGAPHRVGGRMG